MVESPTQRPSHPLNTDVKCLRCGAMNIPENKICGRCGASLPLIYDEDGEVFSWTKRERVQELLRRERSQGLRFSPAALRWLVRVVLILFSILVAWWILRHR